MKRLLFLTLFLCNSSLMGANVIKSLFVKESVCSIEEQIKDAITNSDIYSVLKLVDSKVSQEDLCDYISMAGNNFGRPPKSSVHDKLFGSLKIVLGMALFYKTVDYFKSELGGTKFSLKTRYNNIHTILMDVAGLSGFISSYTAVNTGLNAIHPHSKYKNQLLIDLYLKSLLKN